MEGVKGRLGGPRSVGPGLVADREAVEHVSVDLPAGHEVVHEGDETPVVGGFEEMGHLVDGDVFQALGRLLSEIRVQADVTGRWAATSPFGLHRWTKNRETFAPMSGCRLHLANWSGVPGNLCVGSDEGDALDEGLRQKQAVEGILMQRGQAIHVYGVLAGDGKLHVPIIEEVPAQDPRLDLEILVAQCRAERRRGRTG